jgi:hypothetical protein
MKLVRRSPSGSEITMADSVVVYSFCYKMNVREALYYWDIECDMSGL